MRPEYDFSKGKRGVVRKRTPEARAHWLLETPYVDVLDDRGLDLISDEIKAYGRQVLLDAANSVFNELTVNEGVEDIPGWLRERASKI